MSRPRCWFVNLSTGALGFVREVTDGHAHLQIIHRANEGSSSYSMPIREYDEHFVDAWRPATQADLTVMEGQHFRLPRNAPPEWADAPEGAAEGPT